MTLYSHFRKALSMPCLRSSQHSFQKDECLLHEVAAGQGVSSSQNFLELDPDLPRRGLVFSPLGEPSS